MTRAELPDWPAMMPIDVVEAYTTLGRDLFLGLAARKGLKPVDLGARRIVWRRREIDAFIDQLPALDSYGEDIASSREKPTEAAIALIDPEEAALQRVRSNARARRR